ncbi:MAG: ABC transporter ATP-binding protein [Planctomycetota bacterium]
MPEPHADNRGAEPLRVEGLSVTWRSGLLGRRLVRAVRGLSLTVEAGSVVGIAGPNGSGKSSLFRALLGLAPITAGSATVLGRPAGDRAAVARTGHLAEGRLPLGRLRARELLTLSGTLRGWPLARARARADALLDRVGLAAVAGRAHGDFSTGMARRLALAQALYHEPELLLLDEPTAGMDPLGVDLMRELVKERAAAGATCLVATHVLEDFGAELDRLVVLYDGEVLADGSPDDVLGREDATSWTVAGLDDEARRAVEAEIAARGGKLLASGRPRRSLGAWLRERIGP